MTAKLLVIAWASFITFFIQFFLLMGQITIVGVSVALILSNPVIRHFDDLTFVTFISYLFSAALIPYSMYQSLGVSACVFPRINICLEALKGFPEEWEIPRRRTMFEIVFTITILFGMVIGTFSHIPDFGVAAVKTGSVHDVMRPLSLVKNKLSQLKPRQF
ncbi:unnamed protein product [Orchesella dallaii]|uniref:Uncharacterized protein n=1 Tax=Orchesella dallaii TaxID=48710 RepID=A0ABP1R4H0_9HEXA